MISYRYHTHITAMSWRRLVCKSARSSVTEVGNDSPHASLVECSVCSPDMSSPSVICDIADSIGTRGFQVCTFSRHYIESNKIIVAMLPEEIFQRLSNRVTDDTKISVLTVSHTRTCHQPLCLESWVNRPQMLAEVRMPALCWLLLGSYHSIPGGMQADCGTKKEN